MFLVTFWIKTNNEVIVGPHKLTYHLIDNDNDENSEGFTFTIDDLKRIAAGVKEDISLDPREKILQVEVVREPIATNAVPVGPVVHHIVLLHTESAKYAIEKFDDGVYLTKSDSVENILKSRKRSTHAVDHPFKEQPKEDRDTIGWVLQWLVDSKQLEVKYHWFNFNCKGFADSLCLSLTGVSSNKTISNFNFIQAIRYSLATWDRSVIEYRLASLIRPIPLPNRETRSRFFEWTYDSLSVFRELSLPNNLSPIEVISSCVPNKVKNIFSKSSYVSNSILHDQQSKRGKMLNRLFYGVKLICSLIPIYFWWEQGILVISMRVLAGYGALELFFKAKRQLHLLYLSRYCHYGTDPKLIIDESLSLTENQFRVSVICDKAESLGGHAFLFFQWFANNQKKFAKVELSIAKRSFGAITKGDPYVKIKQSETFNQALILLEGSKKPFFATFERQGDVEKYLEDLKKEKFTFSSLGDHSAASLNSRDNNQNCASWCVLALNKIGIKIEVSHLKTPQNVVLSARRHKDRVIRHLITDSIPPHKIIKIYVCCNPEIIFGEHAFLIFQWASKEKDNVVSKFFRAELSITRDNISSLSGEGNVKRSNFVTGLEEGKNLLTIPHPYFACFSYECKGDIEAKLRSSSIFTRDITFKLPGDNSSTQLSNLNDFHNCATFINFVLRTDFNIELGLESKYQAVTTPLHLVNLADEHKRSE